MSSCPKRGSAQRNCCYGWMASNNATKGPDALIRNAALPSAVTPPAYLHNRRCNTRNLAGNPDSPQAAIFLTSITDVMMGFETYCIHYHAVYDCNTSAWRSAKPGQRLSGQTSSVALGQRGALCQKQPPFCQIAAVPGWASLLCHSLGKSTSQLRPPPSRGGRSPSFGRKLFTK